MDKSVNCFQSSEAKRLVGCRSSITSPLDTHVVRPADLTAERNSIAASHKLMP